MTTAALLQATSSITDTVIAAAFDMAGAPGGYFDAQPTDTIVTVLNAPGSCIVAFQSFSHTIVPVAYSIPAVGPAAFAGESILPGNTEGVFTSLGLGTVGFIGEDAQPVVELIPVRFITGPESGVIPVEIVDAPGEDVLSVSLIPQPMSYTPIFVDPLNPMRKKVYFPEGRPDGI